MVTLLDCAVSSVLYVFCSSIGWAALIVKPQRTEVLVAQKVYLNCSTNIASGVHWFHYHVRSDQQEHVYLGGNFYGDYIERFKISKENATGRHDLIILSVKTEDAGKYVCHDDIGRGEKSEAELIVLERHPHCQSNISLDDIIGPTDCEDIIPDRLGLSCTVAYRGNYPPQMKWINMAQNISIGERVPLHIHDGNVTYNLIVTADLGIDGYTYICQTSRALSQQYKCSLGPINVKYSVSSGLNLSRLIDEELICFANSTYFCKYRWFLGNDSLCPVSCNQLLKPHKVGEYKCEAKCLIRGEDCTYISMKANVQGKVEPESYTVAVIVASVLAVAIITIVVIVLVCLRKTKMERMKTKMAAMELQELVVRTEIRGLAVLGMEVFVVRNWSTIVEVYDTKKFNYLRRWEPTTPNTNLGELWDIVSCTHTQSLYIGVSDSKSENCEILKVSSSGETLMRWLTEDACGRLSVSRKSYNLLLTVQEKNKLIEYSSDGLLLDEVNLSEEDGLVGVQHAVKLDNGRFVVSHVSSNTPHRVCLVDSNGRVLESFGKGKDCADKQQILDVPICVAVDDEGSIFVADQFNSRVIKLNTSMKFEHELIPGNNKSTDLENPLAMHLDESNGRLLVADSKIGNRRLFVLQTKLMGWFALMAIGTPGPVIEEHILGTNIFSY